MISRRRFIKNVGFVLGGALAAPGVAQAGWWHHAGRSQEAAGVATVSYSAWDEASETTLEASDTFVCIAENTVAGGNETAMGGGLEGADLVLTQAGTVAGVSGGFRTLDGINDRFRFTVNTAETLLSGKSRWSVIEKFKTAAVVDTSGYYFRFWESDQSQVQAWHNGTAKMSFTMRDVDNANEAKTTTASLATSTEYYAFLGCDGTKTRGAFMKAGEGAGLNGQPIRWSNFPASQRVTFVGIFDNIGSIDSDRFIGTNSTAFLNFLWKYIVITSGKCLVDFNS